MADLLAKLTGTGAFWTTLVGGAGVATLGCIARIRARGRILRLWPLGLVVTAAFVAALTVAASVFYAGWDLLGAQGIEQESRFTSRTLFDLVKLSFGVVAGAGALVALVVAYRRQRVAEKDALRETTRLHTERFTNAVSQLGEEQAVVRLGAVHALAGLADDAPTAELRQTCIDVLCAYLRLPYTSEAGLTGDARDSYLALREVRHTVIRLVRDHLRLPADHPHTWQKRNFDFTNVSFDGGDLSGAQFSGTVDFTGARFSGTVDFSEAQFSGTVDFTEAQFSGDVPFNSARFSGGVVNLVSARFSGVVNFRDALFSDGLVDFTGAQFAGGLVEFAYARFADGRVAFRDADFSGGIVGFTEARFDGAVVDLSAARGPAPVGLIPDDGSLPDGVSVPAGWLVPEPDDGSLDPA